ARAPAEPAAARRAGRPGLPRPRLAHRQLAGYARPGVTAVQGGHAKGQVQGLAAGEARIPGLLVAGAQVALADVVPTADALGDVVAGEFDVDAAGVGAEGA